MSSLIKRLALIPAGLIVGLVLAEGLARILDPSGGADLLFGANELAPADLYQPDEALGHSPTPGFSGTIRSLGFRVPLQINALGLRGPEIGGDPAGERWLAVGDSFTMSLQVTEAETFEGLLSEGGREVLNGGVDAYSTWQAGARYAAIADRIPLDVALLVFFTGNDFHDNQRPLGGLTYMAPPEVPALTRALMAWSYLYGHLRVYQKRAALESWARPQQERWRDELAIFTAEGRGRLEQLLPMTRSALQSVRDEAAERGDRLLVAVAPTTFQISPERASGTLGMVGLSDSTMDLGQPTRAVLQLLGDLGVDACDLTSALEASEAAGPGTYFFCR